MTKKRSDGEGSIYFDKSRERWIGVLVLGYRDGKPIRRKVSANTKSGAAAKLRDLRERLVGNELPSGRVPTVEEWMTYWYKRIAPRKVKPLTIAGYNAKVSQYIIPLLGHHRLDRLTPEHIEDAWDRLREEGNPTLADPTPLSANTIHQTHRILARALKVAVQRKKLRNNPAGASSMDAPPHEDHEITPMTEQEVAAIREACRGVWNEARWNVALAVGLRQGEALGLRWEDVDLDNGVLRIRQTLMRLTGQGIVFGTPKSSAGIRDVVLPGPLAEAMRTHKSVQNAKRLELGSHWTDSGLVFTLEDGRPLDPSVDAGRWRALLQAAGVKHYRLHDARHSAATMLLLDGVKVEVAMKILGHSQIGVTMRYRHVVDEMMQDAAKKMEHRWA